MKALVFAPMVNQHGNDAIGAFQPQAHAFCKAHDLSTGVRLFRNDFPLAQRFSQIIDWLEAGQPQSCDTLVFCCHGWKTGMQFGVTPANSAKLAEALKRVATPDLRVVLYACSTGSDNDGNDANDTAVGPGGEGGMADAIRDALVKAGIRATIYAHATVGHCTANPWLRRFDPGQVAGGNWVIEPHSELWHSWVTKLQDERSDFRFRMPFMAQADLEAELRGAVS